MANYEVKGTSRTGKNVKIYIESDSAKSARSEARKKGVIPISVQSTDAKAINEEKNLSAQVSGAFKKVSLDELSEFTRQLSSLVRAHVPIVDCFNALIDQSDSSKMRPMIMAIRQNIKEGKTLGDSFAQFPAVFDRIYVNMVRAGEASGRLDVVLQRLADFGENQVRLRNKVTGAMTYPIIMIIVGVLAMVGIFTFVIPKITQIFREMKTAMPWITMVMIKISDFLRNYWFFLMVGVLLVVILVSRFLATAAGRAFKDRLFLKLPVFGDLVTILCVSRFARTLGTLLQSGVPMITALQVTKNVVNNTYFEKATEEAEENVREGRSLAYSLKNSKIFPPICIHMVNVGEKTGELENMLNNLADNYDQQVDSKLGKLITILEPLMIIGLVGMVALIVVAVLLPIFEMQNMGTD